MTVGLLRDILLDHPSTAIVQINVSDHAQTLSLPNIGTDDEYDTSEAIVLTVSIDEEEDMYFANEN